MKIPRRHDCIHFMVCRYDDNMCPTDCGYFEELNPDKRYIDRKAIKKHIDTTKEILRKIRPDELTPGTIALYQRIIQIYQKVVFEILQELKDENTG